MQRKAADRAQLSFLCPDLIDRIKRHISKQNIQSSLVDSLNHENVVEEEEEKQKRRPFSKKSADRKSERQDFHHHFLVLRASTIACLTMQQGHS